MLFSVKREIAHKKNLRKIQAGKINEASVEKIMEKEFVNWKSSEKKLSTRRKVKLQKNSPRKKKSYEKTSGGQKSGKSS